MSIMAIKYTSFLGASANGKHRAVRRTSETTSPSSNKGDLVRLNQQLRQVNVSHNQVL